MPIDAILFGGRPRHQRPARRPRLQLGARRLHGRDHGLRADRRRRSGTVGELRRDPFAMLPFCGYNMADYWAHWLRDRRSCSRHPAADLPRQLVPQGRGRPLPVARLRRELRVLDWAVRRVAGDGGGASRRLSGCVPAPGALDWSGLDISDDDLAELFQHRPERLAARVRPHARSTSTGSATTCRASWPGSWPRFATGWADRLTRPPHPAASAEGRYRLAASLDDARPRLGTAASPARGRGRGVGRPRRGRRHQHGASEVLLNRA